MPRTASPLSVTARLAILLAVTAAYFLSFSFLHQRLGGIVSAVSIVPVAVSGWLLGIRAGIIAGAVVSAAGILPQYRAGWDTGQLFIGSLMVTGVGAAIGHFRDVSERWKAELVRRRQMEESLEKKNRELAAVGVIAQSLGISLKLDDVLRTAIEQALGALGLKAGAIYLVAEDGGALMLAASAGLSAGQETAVAQVAFGEGLPGKVSASNASLAVSDMARSGDTAVRCQLGMEGCESEVGVPLRSKGKTIGVLAACSRVHREFLAEKIALLEVIASQIGAAIDNARLFERMSELSLTDELTGLYNRRHFNQVLDSEILRSGREERPFSVVLVDIDSFKGHNDRHGHPSGDQVLRALANALRSAPRKTDAAFRLGGDEFAIILPASTSEVARRVVERIRMTWQSSQPEVLKEDLVDFSVGIAEFPRDGQTAADIVSAADAALYEAKGSKKQARDALDRRTARG